MGENHLTKNGIGLLKEKEIEKQLLHLMNKIQHIHLQKKENTFYLFMYAIKTMITLMIGLQF